ncbi:hypothetical protein ACTD5D_40760 [Nocardia takedensis]|uniref:hypothetical protein n=1 Tax=Nocardia takedensis TaxID=259390 RepID=UPI003F75B75F
MTDTRVELVTLSGTIDTKGTFTYRRADPATGRDLTITSEGGYRYEVLDARGTILDRRAATFDANGACNPVTWSVAATVRLTDTAESVRLLDTDTVLWQHPVEAAPHLEVDLCEQPCRENPAVLNLATSGGPRPDYVRVAWHRDDTDTDIVVLAAKPFTPRTTVDLDWVPGGTGVLHVSVGAGVRTASAHTSRFTLPSLGKYLTIHQPRIRTRSAPGCSVHVSAGVLDLDHPDRGHESMPVEWLVDDEPAATGLNVLLPGLRAGRRTITARLRDQPSLTATVTIDVAGEDAAT